MTGVLCETAQGIRLLDTGVMLCQGYGRRRYVRHCSAKQYGSRTPPPLWFLSSW